MGSTRLARRAGSQTARNATTVNSRGTPANTRCAAAVLNASQFANYASNGSLYAYGDQVDEPDDFYQSLRDTFTFDDTLQCVPKDFSTIALEIIGPIPGTAGSAAKSYSTAAPISILPINSMRERCASPPRPARLTPP